MVCVNKHNFENFKFLKRGTDLAQNISKIKAKSVPLFSLKKYKKQRGNPKKKSPKNPCFFD